jgi:beta-mannanase
MNGNFDSWATGAGNPNGNTPAQYVAAWKHVHDLFTKAGATNAIWVWCTLESGYTAELKANYPGDAYVDRLGFDAYNNGTLDGSSWRAMVDVFRASYDAVASISNKPIIVGQTASTDAGGDKAAWITQGMLVDVPQQMPRIQLIVWFNTLSTRPSGSTYDWQINIPAAALTAYQSVAASPLYRHSVP